LIGEQKTRLRQRITAGYALAHSLRGRLDLLLLEALDCFQAASRKR
jgi:hypothetical protein